MLMLSRMVPALTTVHTPMYQMGSPGGHDIDRCHQRIQRRNHRAPFAAAPGRAGFHDAPEIANPLVFRVMTNLIVNGQNAEVEADGATPLLWVLREHLKTDRHQVWLRQGPVRCLHCSHRWHTDFFLPDAAVRSDRQGDYHDRGVVRRVRPPIAKSMGRPGGCAVRLLSVRPDNACCRPVGSQQQFQSRGNYFRDEPESMPLRNVSGDNRGDSAGRR